MTITSFSFFYLASAHYAKNANALLDSESTNYVHKKDNLTNQWRNKSGVGPEW